MKVELGKRYKRRDGTITPPLEGSRLFPGLLMDTEFAFVFDAADEEAGNMLLPEEGETEYDLIEEYKE